MNKNRPRFSDPRRPSGLFSPRRLHIDKWNVSFLAPFWVIAILLISSSLVFAQDTTEANNKVYLPVISSGSGAVSALDEPLHPDEYDSQQQPVIDENANSGRTFCLTYVQFTNQSSYTINIYWVNTSGGESFYKTLNPNSSYWQQTYWGHRWRIRTTSGALVKEITVYSCLLGYVVITNRDFASIPTPTKTPVPPTATKTAIPPTATPTGTPVGTVNLDPNLTYKIVSGSSGKLLSANPNQAATNGQKIVLFSDVNAASQMWRVVPVGGGYYNIVSVATGRVLDVNGSTQNAGEQLQLWSLNNGTNQQWRVAAVPAVDYVTITARHSGQNVDVSGSGTADLTPIIQWPANGQKNQQWKFVPVGVLPTATPTNTLISPTVTPTDTSVPPTATPTNTSVPPTATPTETSVPPTATPTTALTADLGNQVWFDLNGNGTQQIEEPYVPNVTVQLLQGCTGDVVLDTQITDVNGFYTFYAQTPGQYRVRFSNIPAGYQFTAKDVGSADNIDSDVDADGLTDCVTVVAGVDNPTVDAGIVSLTDTTASISGVAWYDANSNGIRETDEAFVLDAQLTLYKGCSATNIFAVQVTDLDGLYTFPALPAGQYRLQVVQDANFTISPKDQTDDTLDSDFDPTSALNDCFNLTSGSAPAFDVGFIPLN